MCRGYRNVGGQKVQGSGHRIRISNMKVQKNERGRRVRGCETGLVEGSDHLSCPPALISERVGAPLSPGPVLDLAFLAAVTMLAVVATVTVLTVVETVFTVWVFLRRLVEDSHPTVGDSSGFDGVAALGFGFDGRCACGGVGLEHVVWGQHGLYGTGLAGSSRGGDGGRWWGHGLVDRERWGWSDDKVRGSVRGRAHHYRKGSVDYRDECKSTHSRRRACVSVRRRTGVHSLQPWYGCRRLGASWDRLPESD